jgi:hypothetical protein
MAVTAPVGGLAVGPRRLHPPPAATAYRQPGQEVPALSRRIRTCARSGAAGGADVMGGDEIRLADQRRVRRLARDDPPVGQVPPLQALMPRLTSAGSVRSRSVRCRFHTCRPVYRGLDKIVVTVPSVHPAPVRCRFRPGSADDGQGTPASFSARAIRATEWPASRRAKIHRTGAAAQRTIRAAAGSRRAGQGGRAGTAGRRLP